MWTWWVFPVLGIGAGLLSGLLGVGGGLLLVGALILLLPAHGVPLSVVVPVALASSLGSIVLTGLSSAYAHHRRGAVLWRSVAWLAPGLMIGAILASYLVAQWATPALRWAVVAYCLLVALQLISAWPKPQLNVSAQAYGWPWSLIGLGIGAVSSVVGIGGGSMTVPLLIARGVSAVKAIATSAVCGVCIALASAMTYSQLSTSATMPAYSYGYVYLPAALGVALSSIAFAPIGAYWAHRISEHRLKQIFAGFLMIMASLLILHA